MPESASESAPNPSPPNLVPCDQCDGPHIDSSPDDCIRCGGTGWMPESRHRRIHDVVRRIRAKLEQKKTPRELVNATGFELLEGIRETVVMLRAADEMSLGEKADALRMLSEAATNCHRSFVSFTAYRKGSL